MEGKPSLTITIEGNPSLIRTTFEEIAYYRKRSFTNKKIIQGNPLLNKEIPDYRRNPLREISKQTVEGTPLVYSKGFPPIVRDLATKRNPLL